MADNQSKLIVLGLVENGQHQFLISQRHDPDIPEAHLKWDLPGGKNDFGEKPEETVVREVLEETGLRIEINHLIPLTASRVWQHKDYQLHTVVLCFSCRLIAGETKTSDPKINDLKWVSKEQLKEFEFLPTTKPFIDYLIFHN